MIVGSCTDWINVLPDFSSLEEKKRERKVPGSSSLSAGQPNTRRCAPARTRTSATGRSVTPARAAAAVTAPVAAAVTAPAAAAVTALEVVVVAIAPAVVAAVTAPVVAVAVTAPAAVAAVTALAAVVAVTAPVAPAATGSHRSSASSSSSSSSRSTSCPRRSSSDGVSRTPQLQQQRPHMDHLLPASPKLCKPRGCPAANPLLCPPGPSVPGEGASLVLPCCLRLMHQAVLWPREVPMRQ